MEVNFYFIGLVVFILIMSQIIRPSRTNRLVGYRTPLSMKNQETWDYGNIISRKYAFVFMLFCIAFHLAASLVISGDELLKISLILLVMSLLSIVIFTEISLRAQFDVNGNRKIN